MFSDESRGMSVCVSVVCLPALSERGIAPREWVDPGYAKIFSHGKPGRDR